MRNAFTVRAARGAAAGLALLVGVALIAAPAWSKKRGAGAVTDSTGGRLLAMRIEGAISPVTAEALESAVTRAEHEGYRALIISIDTPGGLESSMRDMVKRLLASGVPTIAWVSPAGAHAASAGVFVTMAADIAAMAPGTNIGAATPINMQGPMDSTLARKATNDAAAFARTVATQRGRNAVWAERAVRHAVAASDQEAVDEHIVDFIARDEAELIAKADGRTWRRGDEVRTLAIRGLPVDRITPGLRQRLLAVLVDPNIAYILLMLGFYGMLFELQNPGAILPGIVGGICLVLAFLALSALPVTAAGLALLLLGIAFLVAEVKVQSHGLLAAGGVVSLLLGSLILFQGEGVRVSWTVIGTVTVATTLFFLGVVQAGVRAQRRPVTMGERGMIGQRAVTIEPLAPDGMVLVDGALWRAVAMEPIAAGANVEITQVEGLTLRVRPWTREART